MRYVDDQGPWLYLDPGQGRIVLRSVRISRRERWLYQGLHSLDFPFLYFRRPLWDIVAIVLSIGGAVLSGGTEESRGGGGVFYLAENPDRVESLRRGRLVIRDQ